MRAEGAVPATIAVVDGERGSGSTTTRWRRWRSAAASRRPACATWRRSWPRGGSAATTVASTSHLAARAGIPVFATGGLGGVHREARESWDESADLTTLAATGITVVCAGVKSILDVRATLERLETLNVCVLGYGTDRFPGFYLADSGFPVPWRVDSPGGGRGGHARPGRARARRRAIVVANPLPADEQVDPELHDRVLAEALAAAAAAGRPRRRDDAVPARPLPPRAPAARRSRRTSRSCCATRRSPPRIARAASAG